MISPYLLDFCPVFLLVFSPLETADFLMLSKPLGDGYSLLCTQKQLPRHKGDKLKGVIMSTKYFYTIDGTPPDLSIMYERCF
jgi:hypothetical protein